MRIGLIAGSGQFPIICAKEAAKKKMEVFAIAIVNETDPILEENVKSIKWIHIGQLKKVITYFKKNEVNQAIMAGGIKKTKMFTNVKPDMKAISMMIDMRHTHDDNLLRAFGKILEDEGIFVKSSIFLLPDLLAPEGCMTKRKLTKAQKKDADFGCEIAKKIGTLDIGQTIVVGGGSVLAVEAIEGSDKAIKRGGKLGNGEAVVVKLSKPNQDMRFNIPAVGIQTIMTMKEANAKALVIEAEKTIAFDRKEMIRLADEVGISITSVRC